MKDVELLKSMLNYKAYEKNEPERVSQLERGEVRGELHSVVANHCLTDLRK